MANSHLAILGTTGAGKSVLLNHLCLALSACYKPHLIVLEIGGSFNRLSDYFEQHHRQVQRIRFDHQQLTAMNPYAEAKRAWQQVLQQKSTTQIDRDYLSDMAMATQLMITRGDQKEEAVFNLTDQSLIHQVLLHALENTIGQGQSDLRIDHVAQSCEVLADKQMDPALKNRYQTFAIRLRYYTQDTVRHHCLNQATTPLTPCDFLQIDLGFLQDDRYRDVFHIVVMTILSHVLTLSETHKDTNTPTIFILDEAHRLFQSPLIAAFVARMAKIARKWGLWLIPCTQNIQDLTLDGSANVLSLIETWIGLSMTPEDIGHLNQIKPITETERQQLLDLRKYASLYAEGMLLGKRYHGVFRHIPPKIALELAMSEQSERYDLKQKNQ